MNKIASAIIGLFSILKLFNDWLVECYDIVTMKKSNRIWFSYITIIPSHKHISVHQITKAFNANYIYVHNDLKYVVWVLDLLRTANTEMMPVRCSCLDFSNCSMSYSVILYENKILINSEIGVIMDQMWFSSSVFSMNINGRCIMMQYSWEAFWLRFGWTLHCQLWWLVLAIWRSIVKISNPAY